MFRVQCLMVEGSGSGSKGLRVQGGGSDEGFAGGCARWA